MGEGRVNADLDELLDSSGPVGARLIGLHYLAKEARDERDDARGERDSYMKSYKEACDERDRHREQGAPRAADACTDTVRCTCACGVEARERAGRGEQHERLEAEMARVADVAGALHWWKQSSTRRRAARDDIMQAVDLLGLPSDEEYGISVAAEGVYEALSAAIATLADARGEGPAV